MKKLSNSQFRGILLILAIFVLSFFVQHEKFPGQKNAEEINSSKEEVITNPTYDDSKDLSLENPEEDPGDKNDKEECCSDGAGNS